MSDVLLSENDNVFSCSAPLDSSDINVIEGNVVEIATTPEIKTGKIERMKSVTHQKSISQADAPLDASQEPGNAVDIAKVPVNECQDANDEHVAKQAKVQPEDTSAVVESASKFDPSAVAVVQVDSSCENTGNAPNSVPNVEDKPASSENNSSDAA